MAIHMSRLAAPISRLGANLFRGTPIHLSSCLSKRYLQEFPENRANNLVPSDYVLVLPEPLGENVNTNELLKISQQQDIDYSKLDAESAFKGLSAALLEFENYITDVNNQRGLELKQPSEFFKDIERHLYPVDSAFNTVIALMNVDGAKFDHQELYSLIQRYYEARAQRFSDKFKESIHEYILEGYKKLPDAEKKLIRLYYKKNTSGSFMRSLDATSQLMLYRRHLRTCAGRFRHNLNLVNQQFSHTVDDPDILASIASEFEDDPTLHHKERTPLKITPASYKKFLRVCPDRFIRQMLWQTYNRRCSPKGATKNNNLAVIEEIRVMRRKVADLSGYRSHVDFKLSEAMAESKQQIMNMIQYLNEENSKELGDRLQELNDYAADNSDMSAGPLEEHDVDYWTHRYAHDILIGQSESQLKQYFSLPDVMGGMRDFFKSYFGIEIQPRDQKKVTCWDESVQVLDVKRNGQLIGSILYDAYLRPGKRVLDPFYARIRCKTSESELAPVRMISTAFMQDINTKEAQLSFADIANLFHSFGMVLQRLLYNYNYYELNVYGAIEHDVNQFMPNLCVAHLLSDHKILQSCSRRDGAKPIDAELATRMLKAHSYFRCFRTWRELYLAHLDLEVHASSRDIRKVTQEIHAQYSPFPRSSDNYDYCAFESMFTGPNDASTYGSLWSKQLVNFCLPDILGTGKESSASTQLVDTSKVRSFNEKLIDSLLAPDNFNSRERLRHLLGRSFEPTKTTLRVV